MAQFETSPPRFAIQVNNRGQVTRDYAYFLENRYASATASRDFRS